MGCSVSAADVARVYHPPWHGRFTADGKPIAVRLNGDIKTATCVEVPLELWKPVTGGDAADCLTLVAVLFSEKRAKDTMAAGEPLDLYYVKNQTNALVATVTHAPGLFMVEVETRGRTTLMDFRKLTADGLLAMLNDASAPSAWSRGLKKKRAIEPLKFFADA